MLWDIVLTTQEIGRDFLCHVILITTKWLPNMGKLSQASSLSLFEQSVEKNTYARTNEDGCRENHDDILSRFGRRPLNLKKKKKKQKDEELSGLIIFCPVV